MGELAVPKRRAEVAVELVGGLLRKVTVFLAQSSPAHAGGELVAELLEGDGEFFPACDSKERGRERCASASCGGCPEEPGMTFLRRATVLVAEAAPEQASAAGADDLTLPTEYEVVVTLDDGRVLRGLLSYVLPSERCRLADYLNEAMRFLPLHGGDALRLVNKDHVTRVAAVER
jgi:hypothetical protein